jgi:hypothetical protein
MKMRSVFIVTGLTVAAISGSSAFAYENYIPLGTGYSSSVDEVPQFDSEQGQVIQQTDVYETELYMKARKRAEEESRLREFFSDAESTGANGHIDY